MADAISLGSPTLDALLEFIALFVADRFRASGVGTNGAFLANAIRGRFPGFSFEQFGIAKLSEAVSLAETRGLVQRDRSVRHLEVLPPGVGMRSVVRQAPPDRPPHIRADIWRAFVYIGQTGARYFDRQAGRVPESTEGGINQESERYVEIKPIPLNVQQEWMEEFLRSKGLGAHDAPIHDAYCFTKFPIWLEGQDATLEREWKRFRVLRVADWVREWASDHNVAVDQFFAIARPRPEIEGAERAANERLIREAIIAAVNDLPIEQIKDISIPVRYLLRAIEGR